MKVTDLFAHWEAVRADTLQLLDRFSQEDLNYQAYPGAWPVGQLFLHIGNCEDFWLHHCAMGKAHNSFDLATCPTHDLMRTALTTLHTSTLAWMAGLTEDSLRQQALDDEGTSRSYYWMIWHVIEHEAHHRGELSLILGLLGRQGLDV